MEKTLHNSDVSGASVLHIYVYDALIKLQPFLP
jgi:hypothetical protein